MRVLIIGLNFHPEPTGIGKYSGEMAAYLAAQGHQVRVITTSPYYPAWKTQPGYRAWAYHRENWQGVEIFRCPLWVPRFDRLTGVTRTLHLSSFAISSLPVLAAQWAWKPDRVLVIAPSLFNAPFALAFARLGGIPAWLHLQDFELEAALNLGILPLAQPLAALAINLERWLLNSFDKASTISGRMLEHLRAKGVPVSKTTCFPNWVDTSQIFPLPGRDCSWRADLGLHPDDVVVLYAGSMGRKQGLPYLLDAARCLLDQPKVQFVLCGDGSVRSALEHLAEDLPNVRFLPIQPAERLNALLNLADIHVLPQMADAADLAMPSKLNGMLASGKPVIVTALPGTELSRVVTPVGVVVPPQDAPALAEAIGALAASPDRRTQLGDAGRQYACQNMDQAVILDRFAQELEALARS